MHPALRSSIPDASLAVFPVNGENSHQGLAGRNPAPNQGHEVCNFTVLLGLQSTAVLNRVGPRSTGKERDAESGNDYFGARYYASSMGRFMSPDWSSNPQAIPYADFTHPQTLNLYQYMQNNPLSGADKDGHCNPLCGWLVEAVSTRVGTYLAQHPDVAKAISKVGDTAGIKGALGFGGTAKVPGAPAIKGEGSITGYVSLSADKGLNEGVEGKLGGKLGPLGGEVSGSLPIVKGGDLVNPITNATGSASGTLTGETESSKLSGAGSANGEDTAIGGNYGEGVVGGLEVSAGTDSLIDVGKEMVNGLINDTKQFVTDIKTTATCTQSSGCTPPK